MAQITTRINLGAKSFPFLARNHGRSVIVGQYDQNFNRQTYSPEDQDKDIGIPQVYYMHNMMPIQSGFQSVGWTQVVASIPAENDMDYVLKLLDGAGHSAWLGVAQGLWYIMEAGHDTAWRLLVNVGHQSERVYVAYINGTSYIWRRQVGCFTYDFTNGSHALNPETILTGLNKNKIYGITQAFGYMIAWGVNKPELSTFKASYTIAVPELDWISGDVPSIGDAVSGLSIPANTHVTSVGSRTNGTYTIGIDHAPTASQSHQLITIDSVLSSGIMWSSTIDPTDFVPSLISGAGGGSVQGARGQIQFVYPHVKGIIVYCKENIVVAPYSANPRYPFDFQAITGSSGVEDPELLTQDEKDSQHFVYSESGIQQVTMLGATTVFPEVTDFLSGSIYESFDDTSKTFSYQELTDPMPKRIKTVLNRYLCISYGSPSVAKFKYMLIYDQISKRWGKAKIDHIVVVELDKSMFPTLDTPGDGLGVMDATGAIWYMNTDPEAGSSDGTLLLGKYQFIRTRNLILDSVELESIYGISKVEVTAFGSWNGKAFDADLTRILTPDADSLLGYSARFYDRTEALNHSLLIQGQFSLDSGVITFYPGCKPRTGVSVT